MPIETVDDILESLADQLGVYGAHDDEEDPDPCPCRVCWTSGMRDRLETAFNVDAILSRITIRKP